MIRPKTVSVFILIIFLSQISYGQKTESEIENELIELHKDFSSEMKALMEQVGIINSLERTHENYLKTDSLYNIYDSIEIEDLKLDFKYAFEHPYSMLVFKRVKFQIGRQPGMKFYDDFEKLYNSVTEEVRNSKEGVEMKEELGYFKKSMPGSSCPEIVGKDFKGNDFDLKEFNNGRMLIIEFWASWCEPCIRDLPFYDDLSSHYDSDKFGILFVNLYDDSDKWRNAIDKYKMDKINWLHFSEAENESFSKNDFFVKGIPHTLVIDRSGMIVGKFKGSGERNKFGIIKLLKSYSDL